MFVSTGLFLMLLFSASCGEKLFPSTKNQGITVKLAYTQTEVPGQEKSKPIDYLKLEFDIKTDMNISMKSVFFKGKKYMVSDKLSKIKINLSKGFQFAAHHNLKPNQAVLSYSIEDSKKELLIDNIESKPPLYLP